ncbi:hypothetical protein Taro_018741, partial [Colocasia esculenta]|nr:hypothetical protein [Colocasia esculenta]
KTWWGIHGAVPFGCEGRPSGVSRVLFPSGEGRPVGVATIVRRMLTEYGAFPDAANGGWWGRVHDMDHILGIFTFKNDAYVIPIHRASGEQFSGKMATPSQSPISPPPMRCMRGHGYCIVRTSQIERNPKRKFYTCKDAKCDFFMWCDEVQNFADSQITCGKHENVKILENRVARLEDELRDLNFIVNKTKMVVKSLPNAFSFLNIVDADGDDGSLHKFVAVVSTQSTCGVDTR